MHDDKEQIVEELLSQVDDHANDEELIDVINSNWNGMRSFFKCHKIMDLLNVSMIKRDSTAIREEFLKV